MQHPVRCVVSVPVPVLPPPEGFPPSRLGKEVRKLDTKKPPPTAQSRTGYPYSRIRFSLVSVVLSYPLVRVYKTELFLTQLTWENGQICSKHRVCVLGIWLCSMLLQFCDFWDLARK